MDDSRNEITEIFVTRVQLMGIARYIGDFVPYNKVHSYQDQLYAKYVAIFFNLKWCLFLSNILNCFKCNVVYYGIIKTDQKCIYVRKS